MFRLSGGAGTGRTVVVLHLARALARQDPKAHVLVTTFTTNLADARRTDVAQFAPDLPIAGKVGESGIYVIGLDALAGVVLRAGTADLDEGSRRAGSSEAPGSVAAHLVRRADTDGYLFDHLLVDEGQDLSPTHGQLLRALVADLILAEDSHQRIYGRRVVLSQFGIRIVGRSRRLTLNYRTTAQTLDYVMQILPGGAEPVARGLGRALGVEHSLPNECHGRSSVWSWSVSLSEFSATFVAE